ncbi:hypothetical protein [Natronomonas gomsonensis]|uniref:hypothetical protein n=1 Tax=Natronomonas gomsonensis TaxID=1046043 RepID=UPI0015B93109|nr:hypothetical protein [Natronomonas gomsonensis]
MATDEELKQRVTQLESSGNTGGLAPASASEELAEYRATTSEIHDELARRIEELDDCTAAEEALEEIIDRLDDLEARLDDLETRN